MKLNLFKVTAIALAIGLAGCNEVKYEPKALGFADQSEMEAAFAKGYHTKQKLLEMQPAPAQVAVAAPPAQVPLAPPPAPVTQEVTAPVSAPAVQPAAKVDTVQTAPSAEVAAAGTCADIKICTNAMLAAAKEENLTAAMDAARNIDTFAKPERGDRKLARKLNTEGLDAFKQGNNAEAINLLTKAHDADKLDEEIISNLVYVYSEDGNYTKAIALSNDGFVLNPRRASLWMPYANASAKLGNQSLALQAMWLAWQFSANKEKMLASIDKKIAEEQDNKMKQFYVSGRAWFVDNKKPSL